MMKRIFELGDTGVRIYVEMDRYLNVELVYAHDNSNVLYYDKANDMPVIQALFPSAFPVVEPAKEVTEWH